ncbi:hypothetical protein ABT369_26400 [Dactylosporangium sp. NPDC000244]|uniref:hypothetical protein n=1 Tax=Dactylosporangium sp. NPDC000244 TaxID=3154365 RepID=UPI00332BE50C
MTAYASPETVAAISVTMQCTVPIGAASATASEIPNVRDLAREVADAISDGRVAGVFRTVLPGAGAAVSVRVIAGHVTVAPASDPAGIAPLATAGERVAVPSTVLLLPIWGTDPPSAWLMAAHQPRRPAWCCATCATPWPCAVQQASLTAAVYAGNGRGVGLTLTGNLAAASLDQPGACPGCLTQQFFSWISDDLYALIVADPSASVTGDGSATRDRFAEQPPDDEPGARPRSRTFTPAGHLPNCPNMPPASARLGSPDGADACLGGGRG